MKVSQLKGKIKVLYIQVPPEEEGGEVEQVTVRYKPGGLDLAALERFETGISDLQSFRMLLEPILLDWDLQKDDGSPLGVTGEDLGSVPVDFLGQVVSAITEEIRPDPQMGGTLDVGSQQKGDLVVLPTGMESSQPQNTWA